MAPGRSRGSCDERHPPRWRGFVECEVLEAREPSLLRYAWDGDGKESPTELTYTLEPHAGGTRLTVEHSGFKGVSGFVFAKLIMTPGWRKMVGDTFPALLADLDDEATLRAGSSLATPGAGPPP